MFSIIIPTWNNLDYLKLCIDSIRKHSQFEHEIIVHVNDGSDGTLAWVQSEGLRHSRTPKNIGVCLAVNHLVSQASREWVLYMNDDMVACPGWDAAFAAAIASSDTDLALYFSTLIQTDGGSGKFPQIVEQDFGSSPGDFDESRLLDEYLAEARGDIEGCASQPTLFHRKWWQMVGGYSLEFSPGMSSDDDLLMKFWVVGCRSFRVVGASRFYHFGRKSTERLGGFKGGRIFVLKWGITQQEFYQNYLSTLRTTTPRESAPHNPASSFPFATIRGKLRRAAYGLFGNYPLGDIGAWDKAAGKTEWQQSEASK